MTLSGRTKARAAAAAAVYAVLALIFFNELVFQTQWFGEDFFAQNFPNRSYAAVEIAQGSLPLWNPYVFSGMPFLADIQTAVLYPFNVVLSLMVESGRLSYALFEYQVVFHFVLGGCFMYFFLRSLDIDFAGALLGGILFAFGGFFINHAHHSNMVHSGIWLPAVFYCCLRGVKRNRGWLWVCPLLLTCSLFGGHPQMTIFIVYAFSAYYFFLAWTSRKQTALKRSVYHFSLVMVSFVLLSLIQILPTAEFLQNTSRGELGFAAAVKDSLPPRALWTFFMADLFLPTYESWQFWEFRCYMSVGGIMLAALGLFARPAGQASFFRVLAIAALILALGENTPVYEAFYTLVPGFKFFRVPARFLLLFVFAASVLAAYGFSAFAGDGPKQSDPERVTAAKKAACLAAGILFLLAIPALASFGAGAPFAELRPHLLRYLAIALALTLTLTAMLKWGRYRNGFKW
ncbi:MAG: hypothetical protein ACE5GQ_00635, partial [Nitrospinales bacterium]